MGNKGKAKNTSDKVKKARRKKALLFGAILGMSLLAVLFVLTLVLPAIPAIIGKNDLSGREEKYPITKTGSKVFYEADFDEDINQDREYLEKNRYIRFTRGRLSFYASKEDKDDLGRDERFFIEYFQTVIAGEYEKYPQYFTGEYLKQQDAVDRRAVDKLPFTAQKLYDIEIKLIDQAQAGDPEKTQRSFYHVEYKIFKNNGTFRGDIDDGAIPLVFTLVSKQDKVLIGDISTYDMLLEQDKY